MERVQKTTELTTLLMAIQSHLPISHPPFSLCFNCAVPSLPLHHLWGLSKPLSESCQLTKSDRKCHTSVPFCRVTFLTVQWSEAPHLEVTWVWELLQEECVASGGRAGHGLPQVSCLPIAVCAQLLLVLYYKQTILKRHFLVGDHMLPDCSHTAAEAG